MNDHVCVCFLQGAMCFLREKDGDLVGHTLTEYGLEFFILFYFLIIYPCAFTGLSSVCCVFVKLRAAVGICYLALGVQGGGGEVEWERKLGYLSLIT